MHLFCSDQDMSAEDFVIFVRIYIYDYIYICLYIYIQYAHNYIQRVDIGDLQRKMILTRAVFTSLSTCEACLNRLASAST